MRDTITIVRITSRLGPVTEYCLRHLENTVPPHARILNIQQAESVPLESRNCVGNMFAALNQCEAGICFMCDDDCLYPPAYFERELDLRSANYARPAYYLFAHTFSRRFRTATSSLAGDRDVLRNALWSRMRDPKFGEQYSRCEPTTEVDGIQVVHNELAIPYIDIRHSRNMTSNNRKYDNPKRAPLTLPYWGQASELWATVHYK